jgi:thiamine-phosphate pyrophosphorylase|tara:strand:+ start:2232 stop:2777 length:546 start_codon:yes stop_codon:yes gene_type:complete
MHKNTNIFYFTDDFNKMELLKLSKNISIIYRNYSGKNIEDDISKISKFCRSSGNKFYVSNSYKLAFKYKADGLYIPSFNKSFFRKNSINRKNFKLIGSAHNKMEIRIKIQQGCNKIFISPIFKNKNSRKALGIIKLNLITNNQNGNFIALGGINQKNINMLKMTKIIGVAAISWIKKTGLK